MHRDLKAENILKHNEKFKIGDFGFSKKLNIHNDEVIGFHTLLGTECTMAPEVINNEKYGLKVLMIPYRLISGQLVSYSIKCSLGSYPLLPQGGISFTIANSSRKRFSGLKESTFPTTPKTFSKLFL